MKENTKMAANKKLILAYFLAMACVACQANRDAERYLPVPTGDILKTPHYKQLLDLLLDDNLPPSQPEDLLTIFKNLAQDSQQSDSFRRSIYEQLIELADEKSSECPAALFQLCFDVAGLTYEVADDIELLAKVGKVMNYVKRYAEKRVAQCLGDAAQFNERISEALKQLEPQVESDLDQLFTLALSKTTGQAVSDRQLYELVRPFEITVDGVDSDKMLEWNRSQSAKPEDAGKSAYEVFVAHLDNRCQALKKPLEQLFNLYNVARAFEKPGAERAPLPADKFLKLNEYNRVCIELSSDMLLD